MSRFLVRLDPGPSRRTADRALEPGGNKTFKPQSHSSNRIGRRRQNLTKPQSLGWIMWIPT